MRSYKIKPPMYGLITLISMITFRLFLPGMTIIPSPWELLGVIPLTFGIGLIYIGEQTFKKARTGVDPFGTSSVLVTYGLYRYTRNPMYLGAVLGLLGVALLLGSVTPFLSVLAFALLIDQMFIRMEEHKLAAAFGAVWDKYKNRTRRWL